MNKKTFLVLVLGSFVSPVAQGARPGERYVEPIRGLNPVFSARPTTAAGEVRFRKRFSEVDREIASKNESLFRSIKPGDSLIIQNAPQEWENQVVKLIDKFDDGSVRVRLDSGKVVFVRAPNLAASLSPEVECATSMGTKICKGDTVFYPARTTSMELPEAPVKNIFSNGAVVVRDGADFIFALSDVGKSVPCSPQKPSVCTSDYVYADGFRRDRNFNFEGPVERAYTNGIVVIRSDRLWRFPIDVAAVKERVASEDGVSLPSVISTRGDRNKDLPYRVTEEIEPLNPSDAQKIESAR